MITYILKLILCSALLIGGYLWLLEKEKMHRFNRFFLLFSIACSFIVPLLTFGTVLPTDTLLLVGSHGTPTSPVVPNNAASTPVEANYAGSIVLLVYFAGIAVLAARAISSLYRQYRFIHRQQKVKLGRTTIVLLEQQIIAHSFFNCILINREEYNTSFAGNAIVQHELAHARQKHSIDLLLLELARIVSWFNPCWLLYKKAIQLNHEFLADDVAMAQCADVTAYQHLLLSKVSQASGLSLTSPFNYSITKKRLYMMTKNTSRSNVILKQLSACMLVAVCTLVFSKRSYAQVTSDKSKTTQTASYGSGTTKALLHEYDSVLARMTTTRILKNGRNGTVIDMGKCDMDRMASIYLQMNKEQRDARKKSGVLWSVVLNPPARNHPSSAQWKKWSDAAQYGVWVDDKRIPNKELSKFQPADFALYYVSRLSPNAIKHDKFYVQVDLYTPAYYNKLYANRLKPVS